MVDLADFYFRVIFGPAILNAKQLLSFLTGESTPLANLNQPGR